MIARLIATVLSWLRPRREERPRPEMRHQRIRLHIPRSVMQELRRATKPTKDNAEPLAFLRVRYASEDTRSVLVAVGVIPFPAVAYVDGDAGANFDTGWAVEVANREIRANAGLMLAHQHGGRGKPGFSTIDHDTNRSVMLPLAVGVPFAPYGAIVLSDDTSTAVVADGGQLAEALPILVADAPGSLEQTA